MPIRTRITGNAWHRHRSMPQEFRSRYAESLLLQARIGSRPPWPAASNLHRPMRVQSRDYYEPGALHSPPTANGELETCGSRSIGASHPQCHVRGHHALRPIRLLHGLSGVPLRGATRNDHRVASRRANRPQPCPALSRTLHQGYGPPQFVPASVTRAGPAGFNSWRQAPGRTQGT